MNDNHLKSNETMISNLEKSLSEIQFLNREDLNTAINELISRD